jgi:hypothetical protein
MTESFALDRAGSPALRSVLFAPLLALAACAGAAEDGSEEQLGQLQSEFSLCDSTAACTHGSVFEGPPRALPDLRPSPFGRGTTDEPAISVINLGHGPAAASSTFLDWGPNCRRHLDTPPISADAAVRVPIGSLPEFCFGSGELVLIADEYAVVAESDETNNVVEYRPLSAGGLTRR